jgi:Type IV secretion-system coupling protein DNA-binding domain
MMNLIKQLAGAAPSTTREPLVVGGVPLAWEQEPLHLLLAGSTGTGKTTAVAELLDGLTARDDRAVIVDPNGAYLAQFGEPSDVVLNVFDKRSPGWRPFNEVRKPYDFDKIARSIVPDGHGPDAAWHFYSQVLIAEVMRALLREGRGDTAALLEALTIWPAEKLHTLVAGTAAAGLFDKEAARALASTRFVLSSHLKPYDSLQPGAFSVRQWVESDRADSRAAKRLFITWREDMTASLAPLIAAWVDIVCTATLSLAPDPQRRLWLLLDELPSIGKIGSLEAALTKGRKHGLCCVAGVQSTAQLERLYGRESAIVLRSCFRNLAVFGLAKADPDTCETFSRALGEREVDRAQQSRSRGASGSSQSVAIQRVRERLVLPAELAELPDLTAFLCLAGAQPARRIALTPRARASRLAAIVE